jgi:hypothetical protein
MRQENAFVVQTMLCKMLKQGWMIWQNFFFDYEIEKNLIKSEEKLL